MPVFARPNRACCSTVKNNPGSVLAEIYQTANAVLTLAEELTEKLESSVLRSPPKRGDFLMLSIVDSLRSDEGQDIAEYAVMLAVILVLVVGTIRLIGSNANSVFSQTASSIQ